MPAKNPRLSVVLSPSLAATLAAVSEEAGESASSLVRGLLEQAAPALERMLELLRAAKGAKGQINSGVADSLHRVVDDLQDAIAVADSRQARVVSDLVAQAEAVKGRRRRGGDARPAGRGAASARLSTPVPVTRGSGPPVVAKKAKGKPVVKSDKRSSRGSV
jgi:hypothetical protein